MSRDAPLALSGARIAQLIESDGPGGAERMLAQLAGALQSAGCPTIAFLPAGGEGWLDQELAAGGVGVEHFRITRGLSPRLARELAAAIRRHGIDLIHSHEFTMAFYGAWAARRAGIPHVITMHGGRYYAGRWRRRVALRAAVALSGGAVAVSRRLAGQLRRDLWVSARRVTTIANGIRYTPAAASTLRAELTLSPEDRLIVAVGNLYPVKGHRYLLEAIALLTPQRPHLHLAIAGRGELAAALEQRAQALGLGARLHLLGLRSDVANVLAGADIFALPSLSEGLPLALLEAMHAGRPIVASNVGDIPVALASGAAGVLVEPGNPARLADAIHRLLTSDLEAQRLGKSAQARAAAEYSLPRMVAGYAELYARRLAGRVATRS